MAIVQPFVPTGKLPFEIVHICTHKHKKQKHTQLKVFSSVHYKEPQVFIIKGFILKRGFFHPLPNLSVFRRMTICNLIRGICSPLPPLSAVVLAVLTISAVDSVPEKCSLAR